MQGKRPYQRHRQPSKEHVDALFLITFSRTIPDRGIDTWQSALHSTLQDIDAIKRGKPLDGPGDAAGEEEEVGREGGGGGAFARGGGGGGLVVGLEGADGEFVLCGGRGEEGRCDNR
jgi:hypothetical protein